MLDAFLALANTKGGASAFGEAAKGIFGDDPSPVLSGQVDARSSFDGSGWTVSTGRSRASGATVSKSGDPLGGPSSSSGTLQAGSSALMQFLMLGLAAAVAVRFLRKEG